MADYIYMKNVKTGSTTKWSKRTYELNRGNYGDWVKMGEPSRGTAEIPAKIQDFMADPPKASIPPKKNEDVAVAESKDYDSMSFNELKEEGKRLGISSNSKKGYIQKLKDYETQE